MRSRKNRWASQRDCRSTTRRSHRKGSKRSPKFMETNRRRESLTYDDRTFSLVKHEPSMKNKSLFTCLLVALFGGSTLADTLSPSKPKFVYIMADDIGWGDLSTHGGGLPTPNIDRLFARGVEHRTHASGILISRRLKATTRSRLAHSSNMVQV